MIRLISDFLSDLTARRSRVFAVDDHRVAATALLVRVAGVDGREAPTERERLETMVRTRFGVDADTAGDILAEAHRRSREASDVNEFTDVLKRALGPEGLGTVVDMLWEVSLVDGATHEFEESLIARIASLLGVEDDRLGGATA